MQQIQERAELSWQHTPVPAARAAADFSATEIGDDIVILDTERLTYHTLNRPAWDVWLLCDGARTGADIASHLASAGTSLPIAAVDLAVEELIEAGLLATDPPAANRVDRRTVLKAAAAGVAGVVMLPMVSSISSPVAADHTTCGAVSGVGESGHCICSAECLGTLVCCDPPGAPMQCVQLSAAQQNPGWVCNPHVPYVPPV